MGVTNMKGSQARTERGKVSFSVKEYADGTPWICVEPEYQPIPALHAAFIGFDLEEGTTLEEAHRIADLMSKRLRQVSMTIFDDHPLYNLRTMKVS